MTFFEMTPSIWKGLDHTKTVTNGHSWYHEKSRNSNTLLVAAGDSWTWGDSLHSSTWPDSNYRTEHIYGNILSEKMQSDFVNLGRCGASNKEIIDRLKDFLNTRPVYDKITVVVTLTELFREAEYDLIWVPIRYNSLSEFIIAYEENMFTYIKQILVDKFTNVHFVFGRNFTYSIAKNMHTVNHLKYTWIDKLAENINRNNTYYPRDLVFLSDMAWNPLQKVLRHTNFKAELIEHFIAASRANDWLVASELNANIATKHPLAEGHKIWADYLYDYLTTVWSTAGIEQSGHAIGKKEKKDDVK